jgi:hypothetical protein
VPPNSLCLVCDAQHYSERMPYVEVAVFPETRHLPLRPDAVLELLAVHYHSKIDCVICGTAVGIPGNDSLGKPSRGHICIMSAKVAMHLNE